MRQIEIVDYDPRWPEKFQRHATAIADALGDTALQIEHIGSTSVPGLSAKPIVDILLVVSDSGDETTYAWQLERAGYELRVREPEFHQHRMFSTPEQDVQLHVFSAGSSEAARVLTFRDRLRGNAGHRRLYEEAKRRLARVPWPSVDAYARAKTEIIERILAVPPD